MIVYTCHQCKAQLQSPDSMSGSFITCPSCKSTLIVPGAAYRPASAPTTTNDAPAVALTTPPAFEAPAAPSSTAPTPPPIPPAISPANPDTAAAFASPAATAAPFPAPATAAYTPVTPPPTPPTPNMPPPPPPFGATMYPPGMSAGRPARVSRLIYVVLAIFLGSFGVHNFAAGHNNNGIIQLIVTLVGIVLTPCTFGISALAPLGMYVWAIIEAVTVTKDADGITMP